MRNYGQSVRNYHQEIGLNSRLDEIHAAILSARLKWLPEFTERRRGIAEAYQSYIDNSFVRLLAAPEEPSAHVHHLYVVVCDQRDALKQHLKQSAVQALIHYPVPIHKQKPCVRGKLDPHGLKNCEHHAACCLSLPCHPQLTESEIEVVIAAVNTFRG